MDLEKRVVALERRLAVLEGANGPLPGEVAGHREHPEPVRDFWALDSLKELYAQAGVEGGGVLCTGAVRLADEERYEWQYGLSTEAVLDTDWSETAEVFAALGHPVRLRLLREILGGRHTAAALAEIDELGTTGQIYHHLRQLSAAGWLHTPGRGRYEVPAPRVVPLLVVLTAARPA
ncbi:ArsR/SmtB family transcription factor [Streptomyces tsukubensis]|uniref:ArsR family transcriptional regulator n=1 Tax=Streptomyces tsukubensis TaxID=83656 RepID=A0A1V4A4H5_9ACTN|nr:helix-turn-helix domain-containing protein [Streptomyces tsukubensis]OON75614.1 ArsR family transcriptional regulator [Streptomyces tsukubensis]QFR94403.1 helix-turn-helix domain-containing protein [Streptomyces tsukubensis]